MMRRHRESLVILADSDWIGTDSPISFLRLLSRELRLYLLRTRNAASRSILGLRRALLE